MRSLNGIKLFTFGDIDFVGSFRKNSLVVVLFNIEFFIRTV